MSALTSLPPELLRDIVDLLCPDWLINLWLTGSRPLHHLLSVRSGVTSLALKKVEGPLSTARLPEMVGLLINLTSLTIKSHSRQIEHPNRIWSCLSKLNQLRMLDLRLQQAEDWMYEWIPASTGTNNGQVASQASQQVLRPIAATFPSLETLKISSKERAFQTKDLPFLPRSLTHLALRSTDFDHESFENLASFHKLSYLRVDQIAGWCNWEIAKLPSSITSFTCNDIAPFPKSFWNDTNLVSFRGGITEECVSELPTTLESLFLTCGYTAQTISLTHLPNLTRLQTELRTAPTLFVCSPNAPLESLPTITIRDMQPSILPSSLTSLRIIAHLNQLESVVPFFKAIGTLSKLEALEVKAPVVQTSFTHDVLQYLPPSLKSLTWTITGIRLFNSMHFKTIPSTLTQLEAPLSAALLELLPRHTLTDLNVTLQIDDKEPAPSYLMPDGSSVFPSTITTLKLKMESPFYRTEAIDDLLNALPLPSITNLSVLASYNAHWTLEMTKRLNPSMTFLVLNLHSLEPGCIAALPRHLTRLGLSNSNLQTQRPGFLTGDELKLLPRSLRHLHLIGADFQFKDEHLADLPSRLLFLQFDGSPLFTSNSINFFPKHCRLFSGATYDPLYLEYKNRDNLIKSQW